MRRDLLALRALASTQGGVVSRPQATELGVGHRSQRARLASGEWVMRFGCLVLGGDADADWRDAWALRLRIGPSAVITGPTAMRLGGLPVENPAVIVAHSRSCNVSIQGVIVMRDVSRREWRQREALRIASPHDALVDSLMRIPKAQAQSLADLALQRRWTDAARLGLSLAERRAAGRNGVAQLARIVIDAQLGTRSHAERRMSRLLRRASTHAWIGNLRVGIDQRTFELDFALPELGLCIEVDGRAHHSGRREFEYDRERQNLLVLAGWTVLRFTWEQITSEPDWVIQQVRLAIDNATRRAS